MYYTQMTSRTVCRRATPSPGRNPVTYLETQAASENVKFRFQLTWCGVQSANEPIHRDMEYRFCFGDNLEGSGNCLWSSRNLRHFRTPSSSWDCEPCLCTGASAVSLLIPLRVPGAVLNFSLQRIGCTGWCWPGRFSPPRGVHLPANPISLHNEITWCWPKDAGFMARFVTVASRHVPPRALFVVHSAWEFIEGAVFVNFRSNIPTCPSTMWGEGGVYCASKEHLMDGWVPRKPAERCSPSRQKILQWNFLWCPFYPNESNS